MASVAVIGIDPGSVCTGWGVVREESGVLRLLDCGAIRVKDTDFSARLASIYHELVGIVGRHTPQEAAVEQVFAARNAETALKLGQARGVAMLTPAMFGISVAEYAPNQVKKTVVGAGHADKNQIAMMLKILLPKAEPPSADAADALAIAITHAHHRQSAALRLKVAGL